jgi:hypothetical protein
MDFNCEEKICWEKSNLSSWINELFWGFKQYNSFFERRYSDHGVISLQYKTSNSELSNENQNWCQNEHSVFQKVVTSKKITF